MNRVGETVGAMEAHDHARDFEEDFGLPNGNYMHRCSDCKRRFFGHKRRRTCKVCDALCVAGSARPAVAETGVIEFARAVLHGDDDHRTWLMQAAEAFVSGVELPPPNGLGRAEAAEREIASLRARVAELEAGLRPFAEEADCYTNWDCSPQPDTERVEIGPNTNLAAAHLREAKRLLTTTPGSQS